jgi:hypothetical protein
MEVCPSIPHWSPWHNLNKQRRNILLFDLLFVCMVDLLLSGLQFNCHSNIISRQSSKNFFEMNLQVSRKLQF